MPELFSKSKLMGTFKGFSEKGFEFAAEIVAPYNSEMQDRPQLGQFLLIQLNTPDEASLGRVTKFVPSGLLASAEGEDYVNTMQEREQDVPEDLKKSKLKYKVQIKLLGAVKNTKVKNAQDKTVEKIVFVPSQRRLPHLGAKVALPSDKVLEELCQLSGGETDLGDYVLGEFVYSGGPADTDTIMRHITPELKVTFNIHNLVSKRSVVFARAGYGKSNLIKFLIGELYRNGVPKTEREQAVGTLIFDADGEYFWPDFKGRPGLCDVPQLQDHMVVFTNRKADNPRYASWRAGDVRLDIRSLSPRDVIGIAISQERQENQNVLKLKAVSATNWAELVDLIHTQGLQAADSEVGRLLGYASGQINQNLAEISAARSNMNNVVNHLHDPQSQLLRGTKDALSRGCCVVIDISMLSSTAGLNVAGLLMRQIFNHNQENFTGGKSPIPVITIIEEAQSVLGKRLEETSPFVEWVKEGRKYDLGAILVTQQPGSMAPELLSQADNWFCFHLLSEGDASTLGKYNAHFSNDILSHLIAEPIIGNCYMWSAPKQPFVLPVRIRSFEKLYQQYVDRDVNAQLYDKSPAIEIKKRFEEADALLADALRTKLSESKVNSQKSFEQFKKDDEDFVGIYGGKLYMILKEIKGSDVFKNEMRTENQLKSPILSRVLQCDVFIHQHDHDGKKNVDFYCAPKANWSTNIT